MLQPGRNAACGVMAKRTNDNIPDSLTFYIFVISILEIKLSAY
jgi:hypothetical protein